MRNNTTGFALFGGFAVSNRNIEYCHIRTSSLCFLSRTKTPAHLRCVGGAGGSLQSITGVNQRVLGAAVKTLTALYKTWSSLISGKCRNLLFFPGTSTSPPTRLSAAISGREFLPHLPREGALTHKEGIYGKRNVRGTSLDFLLFFFCFLTSHIKSCSPYHKCNMSCLSIAFWSMEAAVSAPLLSLRLPWWISPCMAAERLWKWSRKKPLPLIRGEWHWNLTFTADVLYS